MFFSASLNAFLPESWKNDGTYPDGTWPKDAVHLTEAEMDLFWKQSAPAGKSLGSLKGRPVWVDLPAPAPPSKEEVEVLRLRAYAEPLTGSDRYFSEAQRMQMMGEPGWEAIRDQGAARFQEIQFSYPWPSSQ